MILSAQVVFAAEEQYDYYNGIKVISDTSFPATTGEDIIAQMAFSGIAIDDSNVQVTVNADAVKRERRVTEKRLLRKRILENGTTIENYSTTITGERWEEHTDNSISVRLKVGFLYEKITSSSGYAYKITSFYHKATLLDSSFRLYRTYETADESGLGFSYDGDITIENVNHHAYLSKSYPVSGSTYSATSYFTKYVLIMPPASGGGCACTLTFQRITTGNLYYFSVNVPIAEG